MVEKAESGSGILLPLLTSPIKGATIENGELSRCAGCGEATRWALDLYYSCVKCQTIFQYRSDLNVKKLSQGLPLILTWQHMDELIKFNCPQCPATGRRCAQPTHLTSYLGNIQATGSSRQFKELYRRSYQIKRGWIVPGPGDCKCNGCWTGGH